MGLTAAMMAALVFLALGAAAAEVPARAGDGPTGLASAGESVLCLADDGGAVAPWRRDGT